MCTSDAQVSAKNNKQIPGPTYSTAPQAQTHVQYSPCSQRIGKAQTQSSHPLTPVVVVVCPLQPSSSVNSGCPGPESSILVSSRWACPISSQVTDHWGELRNRTGEVHPVDPFHSLDILKNHFASVAFCRNSGVYNVQNGAVIGLSFVVSVKGFPRH